MVIDCINGIHETPRMRSHVTFSSGERCGFSVVLFNTCQKFQISKMASKMTSDARVSPEDLDSFSSQLLLLLLLLQNIHHCVVISDTTNLTWQ